MSRIDSLSDELASLNSSLLLAREEAESTIARIQPQLVELAKSGLLPREVLLGTTIQRPYDADQGPHDSGQIVQAALLLPEGFGVCLWDTEEYVRAEQGAEGLEKESRNRFQPFERCSTADKILVGRNAEDLFEDLMELARAAASRLEDSPTVRAEDYFRNLQAAAEPIR